jgi:aspartate aminotransferase
MKAGFTHYSPVAGIPELRAAVAKKLKTENNLDYSAAEIVLTNGAKQAIANAILAIIDHGDEVIMLAPFWASYEITVRFAGGTPWCSIPTSELQGSGGARAAAVTAHQVAHS